MAVSPASRCIGISNGILAPILPGDRRPGRRERSPGVRQSLDRAPCGSDRGMQRWEHQEPYEDPTPRMGTMEDREAADCPIDTTHLCTIQENICTLQRKNTMRRAWKRMCVRSPLPWIIWSRGMEGTGERR